MAPSNRRQRGLGRLAPLLLSCCIATLLLLTPLEAAPKAVVSPAPPACRWILVSGAGTDAVNGWYQYFMIWRDAPQWCKRNHKCINGDDSIAALPGAAGAYAIYQSGQGTSPRYTTSGLPDPYLPQTDLWVAGERGQPPAPTTRCSPEPKLYPSACPFLLVSGASDRSYNGWLEPWYSVNRKRAWIMTRRLDGGHNDEHVVYYNPIRGWALHSGPSRAPSTYKWVGTGTGDAEWPATSSSRWRSRDSFPTGEPPFVSCHTQPLDPTTTAPPNVPPGELIPLPIGSTHRGVVRFGEAQMFNISARGLRRTETTVAVQCDFFGQVDLFLCCKDDPRTRCPSYREFDQRSPADGPSPHRFQLNVLECRSEWHLLAFGQSLGRSSFSLTAQVSNHSTEAVPMTNGQLWKGVVSRPEAPWNYFGVRVPPGARSVMFALESEEWGVLLDMTLYMRGDELPTSSRFRSVREEQSRSRYACFDWSLLDPSVGTVYFGIQRRNAGAQKIAIQAFVDGPQHPSSCRIQWGLAAAREQNKIKVLPMDG